MGGDGGRNGKWVDLRLRELGQEAQKKMGD